MAIFGFICCFLILVYCTIAIIGMFYISVLIQQNISKLLQLLFFVLIDLSAWYLLFSNSPFSIVVH